MFRYDLFRTVSEPGEYPVQIVFVGVNPSRADHEISDQTVTKLHEFTRRTGAFRFTVVNLFSYRATDVRELAKQADPVGPLNDSYLNEHFSKADIIVPMWGSRSKIPKSMRSRIDVVKEMIVRSNKIVLTFGFTKGGDPKHPLMLAYATKLELWDI